VMNCYKLIYVFVFFLTGSTKTFTRLLLQVVSQQVLGILRIISPPYIVHTPGPIPRPIQVLTLNNLTLSTSSRYVGRSDTPDHRREIVGHNVCVNFIELSPERDRHHRR
jgi:hypothetical protein